MSQWDKRLRATAERVFPPLSKLVSPAQDPDWVVFASWLLPEGERRTKHSKVIRLAIERSAVRRYWSLTESERERCERRLERLLRSKLAAFNPHHDTPLGVAPPIERWDISIRDLVGTVEELISA